MGRRSGPIGIVEAAYAAEATEEQWLDGMVRVAEPAISEGLGACAYVYDASRAAMQIGTFAGERLRTPKELLVGAVESVDEEYIANTWRKLSFGLGSQLVPFDEMPAARPLIEAGIRDMIAINAFDPSGIGVWLGAPLPKERGPKPGEAEQWTRVAAHIAAAFRLRRSAKGKRAPENAAAVLTSNGKIDHARDPNVADALRNDLREAALRMERARGAMRTRDPNGALDLWRTLVDARFTLLDHFERGGRRYIVAVENLPSDNGPSLLTQRERQVLAAAATGRTNKLIAYELGLSHSTVRVLLARAARKLDAATRKELVAIYLAHARATRTTSDPDTPGRDRPSR
jgi:DNA-binding CsgD family transcriptional regulator